MWEIKNDILNLIMQFCMKHCMIYFSTAYKMSQRISAYEIEMLLEEKRKKG